MPYEPLDFESWDELDQEVLAHWRAEDLFAKTLVATESCPAFVFYEGPPTANGRPGIHHVFARSIKDLVCRYQTMLGKSVTRIAGWDTHGLPVEIEVEKELGLSGKEDIEKFGVAEFNKKCRESVFRYRSDWESLSERIGYWLDYKNPYVTYTNDYIESVWWLLKRLADKDLLYQGNKVLPYCIRCGTALSSHELAQGYETHRSPSIYVLLKLRENSGAQRNLLVWTTTPWTLPSNVAVAVNRDFTYVDVDVKGVHVIVEKSIAQRLSVPGATGGQPLASFPIAGEIAGSDLVGLTYEQLIDAVDVDADRAFRVCAADFVTKEEGTGLVHCAPAYGADDYALVMSEDLAFFKVVDEGGRFRDTSWEELNGKTVFETNDLIADRLAKEGKLFGRYEPKGYEHVYPFCWRCDSPLIYYAMRSWFVRTTAVRDRMVEINESVGWHPPEVGSGRFGEWLENNVDWALSRDRYWGTPLPIWVCARDSEHRVVIGSFAELAKRAGSDLPDRFDPHKPYIDEVTIECDQCAGVMHRVPEVIDAWFDSGAMPFAQWHYPFENEAHFKRHFPADFICEGIDQTRGWFYSLLAIAASAFDEPAFRNVVVNELVLDADGLKMSKRVGNVVDPWEVVGRFGADAVRVYLLAASQAWIPKKFDRKAIPDFSGGFLNRLRNSYSFFALYAEDWQPSNSTAESALRAVDRWLLGTLDHLVARVRECWSAYDVTTGLRAIMEFCDNDLSNWYVRVTRSRFWAPDSSADPAALYTLHRALTTVSRLLAPAAPFVSDAMHRRLTGKSVHLERFPEFSGEHGAPFEAAMNAVRKFASLARATRETAGLKVRQPLGSMRVAMPQSVDRAEFNELSGLLAAEVNVKRIEVMNSDAELVTLRARPNFRSLGKVYGKDTPLAAAAASGLAPDQLRELESGSPVSLDSDGRVFAFRPEDIVVEREVHTDWLVQSEGAYVVALDPTVTSELKQEGIARELVNRIQRLRKDSGYDYTTRIELGIMGPPQIMTAIEIWGDFVLGETLARNFVPGDTIEEPDLCETVAVEGNEVTISLRKLRSEGVQ